MKTTTEEWVTTSEWVRTAELASKLCMTSTNLLRKKDKFTKDGTWIEGQHWIKTGEVGNSHILFNAPEVLKTFVSNRAPSKGGNQ